MYLPIYIHYLFLTSTLFASLLTFVFCKLFQKILKQVQNFFSIVIVSSISVSFRLSHQRGYIAICYIVHLGISLF